MINIGKQRHTTLLDNVQAVRWKDPEFLTCMVMQEETSVLTNIKN